jgi:hypothetical protein
MRGRVNSRVGTLTVTGTGYRSCRDVFFAGFSLYISNIEGRNSEAAIGRGGARSVPLCLLMSFKRRMRTRG